MPGFEGFKDPRLQEAGYSISREPGKSANELQLTVKLHKEDPEIFLQRISNESLVKRATDLNSRLRVISSKDIAPRKAEVWYLVDENDLEPNKDELMQLLKEIEVPKSETQTTLTPSEVCSFEKRPLLGATYRLLPQTTPNEDKIVITLQDNQTIYLKKFTLGPKEAVSQIEKLINEGYHTRILGDENSIIIYAISNEDNAVLIDENTFEKAIDEIEGNKPSPLIDVVPISANGKFYGTVKASFDRDDHELQDVQKRVQDDYPNMKQLVEIFDQEDNISVIYFIPIKLDQATEQLLLESIKLEEELPSTLKLDPNKLNIVSHNSADGTILINYSEPEQLAGEGQSAKVYSHQAVKLPSEEVGPSNISDELVAVKEGDIAGEAKALRKLWFSLEKVAGVNGAKLVKGIQLPYIRTTPKLTGEFLPATLYERQDSATNEEKSRYAIDLIQGLFWLQLVGSIHTDIKPQNCMVKGENAFIIDHPNKKLVTKVETLEQAMSATLEFILPRFSPTFTDLRIIQHMQNLTGDPLTEIMQNFAKEIVDKEAEAKFIDDVNFTLDLVRALQTFQMGFTLYELFTQKFPYPTVDSITDFEEAEKMGVDQLVNNLMKAGCPENLAYMIDDMLNVIPENRPTLFDFVNFIKEENPEIAETLDLVQITQWKQQPSLIDNVVWKVGEFTKHFFGF
jgi:serine/threonine protein kinase